MHKAMRRMRPCCSRLCGLPTQACLRCVIALSLVALKTSVAFLSSVSPSTETWNHSSGRLSNKIAHAPATMVQGTGQVLHTKTNRQMVHIVAFAALLFATARHAFGGARPHAGTACAKPRLVVMQAVQAATVPATTVPAHQSKHIQCNSAEQASMRAEPDAPLITLAADHQAVPFQAVPSGADEASFLGSCSGMVSQDAHVSGQCFTLPCKPTRMLSAQRIGYQRFARTRTSASRAAFAQARAHQRSTGARLESHCGFSPQTLSYDPSCVRNKIQIGLQAPSQGGSASGREIQTSPGKGANSRASIHSLGRHFQAMEELDITFYMTMMCMPVRHWSRQLTCTSCCHMVCVACAAQRRPTC